MNKALLASVAAALTVLGCATPIPARAPYGPLVPLQDGSSRVIVTAGKMNGLVRLSGRLHVGFVLLNDVVVGSTAKDEHFAVDVLPGTYDMMCTPFENDKTFTEKVKFTFKAGETRYFACDMGPTVAGVIYGTFATYSLRMFPTERPLDNPGSRLVGYMKLP